MRLSRLLAAPVLAGALLLTQAVGISPARAGVDTPVCDSDINFHACLRVLGTTELNQWKVLAGQDAFMSQRYAQEIIDHGAQFRGTLWGDDGGSRSWLADLAVEPGWPSAGPEGLGVEMSAIVSSRVLNEDTSGQDELYAEITYFDYHVGQNVTHRTGTVRGDFTPGTPSECVVICP